MLRSAVVACSAILHGLLIAFRWSGRADPPVVSVVCNCPEPGGLTLVWSLFGTFLGLLLVWAVVAKRLELRRLVVSWLVPAEPSGGGAALSSVTSVQAAPSGVASRESVSVVQVIGADQVPLKADTHVVATLSSVRRRGVSRALA